MWLSRLAFLCATLAPFVVWQTPQFASTLCVVTPLPKVLIARIYGDGERFRDGEHFRDARLKLRRVCTVGPAIVDYVDRRSTDYFVYVNRRSTE